MSEEREIRQVGWRDGDRRPMQKPCTARTTNDLFDCDCGYVTAQMKIHILAEREEHDWHTLIVVGGGEDAGTSAAGPV